MSYEIHAGAVDTVSVSRAAGEFVSLEIQPARHVFLTPSEARELAARLNALADAVGAGTPQRMLRQPDLGLAQAGTEGE
jgi:hypothetical protein